MKSTEATRMPWRECVEMMMMIDKRVKVALVVLIMEAGITNHHKVSEEPHPAKGMIVAWPHTHTRSHSLFHTHTQLRSRTR